ncbi:MAG TPA: hypothetical protein VEA59_01090 [Patescibacteria group bacterium]|nr:hypothetical protein [Patescibacteria group bacterium]
MLKLYLFLMMVGVGVIAAPWFKPVGYTLPYGTLGGWVMGVLIIAVFGWLRMTYDFNTPTTEQNAMLKFRVRNEAIGGIPTTLLLVGICWWIAQYYNATWSWGILSAIASVVYGISLLECLTVKKDLKTEFDNLLPDTKRNQLPKFLGEVVVKQFREGLDSCVLVKRKSGNGWACKVVKLENVKTSDMRQNKLTYQAFSSSIKILKDGYDIATVQV